MSVIQENHKDKQLDSAAKQKNEIASSSFVEAKEWDCFTPSLNQFTDLQVSPVAVGRSQ
jgi:hypothetical protein